jgi:hypothetical protein
MDDDLAATTVADDLAGAIDPRRLRVGVGTHPVSAGLYDVPTTFRVSDNMSLVPVHRAIAVLGANREVAGRE